jgi:hypothetical protein
LPMLGAGTFQNGSAVTHRLRAVLATVQLLVKRLLIMLART